VLLYSVYYEGSTFQAGHANMGEALRACFLSIFGYDVVAQKNRPLNQLFSPYEEDEMSGAYMHQTPPAVRFVPDAGLKTPFSVRRVRASEETSARIMARLLAFWNKSRACFPAQTKAGPDENMRYSQKSVSDLYMFYQDLLDLFSALRSRTLSLQQETSDMK